MATPARLRVPPRVPRVRRSRSPRACWVCRPCSAGAAAAPGRPSRARATSPGAAPSCSWRPATGTTRCELTGRTLDGARFDVSDHRGEVVVVNVWGSWCPPCIAEAADLQDVWAADQAKGVQFVGINFRDNRDAALAHERRFGVTYPSIDDGAGETLLQLRGSLPPRAIPSTLVLDNTRSRGSKSSLAAALKEKIVFYCPECAVR